jgi:hypothetical protein
LFFQAAALLFRLVLPLPGHGDQISLDLKAEPALGNVLGQVDRPVPDELLLRHNSF